MPSEGPGIQSLWILNRAIAGIEASFIGGAARAGLHRELPEGARLLVCGAGFDEHTAKVLWKGHYYFVYARDLSSAGISH
jgi:hypothetical protein